MSKGIGYSLEAIVAVATILIFVFGSLKIPPGQDWTEFRTQVSAEDLTYAVKESGYLNHMMREGETGSLQTYISTASERDFEVSGLISNLPISQNKMAFYTRPARRFNQNIEPVESGDKCEGDLEEITNRAEGQVLRADGSELAGPIHSSETLYIGDLDPKAVGSGDGKVNYDAVWVDNGSKDCQFAEEDGPYYLDDIFKWENHYYDLEGIDNSSNNMRLYRATQPIRLYREADKPINGVQTFVSMDAVNFSEVENNDYNLLVFRESTSLPKTSANISRVQNFMSDSSVLVMADMSASNFSSGSFMDETGFKYVGSQYNGGYSGGAVSGEFAMEKNSQDTDTYFQGLGGDASSVSLASPDVISSISRVEASKTLFHSSETYDFSRWNRSNKTLENVDPSNVEDEPESECYHKDEALTQGNLTFPDGKNYSVLNAELGTSDSFCNDNNERAVMIDLDRDGNYSKDEGPFLNQQILEIANRDYVVEIMKTDSNPGCNEGECVGFRYIGERTVNLVPRRTSFQGFDGERMAVMSYSSSYDSHDLKLIASVVNWLRGDKLNFVGLSPPKGISTSTYGGIQDKTFMPYRLNLRWSR